MRAIRAYIVACALVVMSPAVHAQQAGNAGAEEAQVRAEEMELQRGEVRKLLARPAVRQFARARGIDVQQAEGAVGTLGAAELQQIAPLARRANEHFAAGGAITISTTTVIIALLIVILVILIA